MLSVDDRKEKPFHCDVCGDTYEACKHWSKQTKTFRIQLDILIDTPVDQEEVLANINECLAKLARLDSNLHVADCVVEEQ